MLDIILSVGLLLALLFYFLVKPQLYWKERNVRQGSPIPFFGDNAGILFRTESSLDMVKRLYNRFPNVRYSGFYQMAIPTLMLRDVDLIKQITVKDFDHFTDHKSLIPEESDPLWNKNLMSLKGESWRDMRATLSPAFTSSKMRAMFTLINDCAIQFVDYFLGESKDGEITLEMKDKFTRYTNDVVATCAFGITCDSLKDPNNEFYLMGKEATEFTSVLKIMKIFMFFMMPRLNKVLKVSLFGEKITNFFMNLVKRTIEIREEKAINRPDMINLLMEARKGRKMKDDETPIEDAGFATVEESQINKDHVPKNDITDMDITAQALIFFFAGFDSASTLMCFMAYELAVNPDIQNKLRQEVDDTSSACNGELIYEKLSAMKYMDMVISETLRKWPSAVASDRVCVKPYTIPPTKESERPVHLKVGDALWLPIAAIHYDPEYFQDPETFDPERFNDDNKRTIKTNTYLPFGVGPRNCIGSRFALMETKTIFYHILSNFEITVVDKTTVPIKISKKQFNITSEGGYWLGLKTRK